MFLSLSDEVKTFYCIETSFVGMQIFVKWQNRRLASKQTCTIINLDRSGSPNNNRNNNNNNNDDDDDDNNDTNDPTAESARNQVSML